MRSACFFFHHRRGSKDRQATKVNVDSPATTFDDTDFRTTYSETIPLSSTTVGIALSDPIAIDIINNTLIIAHYHWRLRKESRNQDHDILLRGHEILTSLHFKNLSNSDAQPGLRLVNSVMADVVAEIE